MKAILSPLSRRSGLLAGIALGLVGAALPRAGASDAKSAAGSDAFPQPENYLTLGLGAPDISGDKQAFAHLFQQPANGFAGIEDLHYGKDLPKDATLTIDGHVLAGSDDYLGQFKLAKTDVGSFEAGFKRFRTYYDGVGGFFPTNKEWLPLANEALATDRSKFWVEGTLNLPNQPVFKIKYTNELRDGQKDSTIWGDTDLTGLAYNLAPNPVSPARKIVPSFIQLDERHQNLEASMVKTFGKTTLQVSLSGDKTDNLDTRYVTRFPGEVIPWTIAKLSSAAQPAQKAKLGPTNWNNQIVQQQSDGEGTTSSAVNAKLDSVLTDKLTLHVGANYQIVHADISGNRPLVTSTATSTAIVPVTTDTFTSLVGGSKVKVYTGNVIFDFKPVPDLSLKAGVKAENELTGGWSNYNVVAASGTPATTLTTTPRVDWENIHQHSATPVLDVRYTGISNLSLYFSGSKRNLTGSEQNISSYNPLTTTPGTTAFNHNAEDHGDYTLGADWRTCTFFELRTEVFDKHHQYESAGYGVNLGDYYLLDSQFKGVKLTAIARPLPELSFTTRYIYQKGTMQVTGFLPTYPAYDSCDAKNYNISESIDWAPNKAIYVQLNGTMVFNSINTVYPRAGVTPATSTLSAWDTNNVLHNSDNNYVTAGALVGFVAAKDVDVQGQYTYYRSNNGDPQMAAFTTPYGAAAVESVVTLGVKVRLEEHRMLSAKIGYADSQNDTTGGFTNFRGPLAYISIEQAL